MYYKLYHNIFQQPPPPERRELFERLYQEYEVELIGVFRNRENPLEYYMLTGYRDEKHYQEFVTAVRDIPEYQQMTARIDAVRISSDSVDLERV